METLGRDVSHSPDRADAVSFSNRDGNKLSQEASSQSSIRPSPANLDVVFLAMGTLGDVQPYLKVACLIRDRYGYRVRIASHEHHRRVVQEHGLQFFSVGGDLDLMISYRIHNPGRLPTKSTRKSGLLKRVIAEGQIIVRGFWRACVVDTDGELDDHEAATEHLKRRPFMADAIISNFHSTAHVHCAQRLSIPLFLLSLCAVTPTTSFPHIYVDASKRNFSESSWNRRSFYLEEIQSWLGWRPLINRVRKEDMGSPSVSLSFSPFALFKMQTPLTYLWSPSVLPKPKDWGPSIQIAGYCFYDPPASYQASQELLRFLEAGEAPIYIGFGSNFILDQGREPLTRLLYDAVTKSGLRAVIAQNWVVSSDSVARPDNVCVVEHTPHAWLFPRMAAIVHHGGAGTVAMTLRCGKPSVCVPFIFDQFSWAVRLSDLGLGSRPLPHTQLTANKLAEAIRAACEGEMETRAKEMAKKIAEERDGAEVAVDRFYKILQTQGFPEQCAFLPGHNAVWQVQGRDVKISGLAAAVLVQEKRLAWEELTLDRRFDWSTFPGFKGQKVSDFKETTTTPVKGQRIAQSIFDFDAVEDGGAAKAEVIDRVVRGWEKPKST